MSGKLFRLEKILTALSKSGTPFRLTPAQYLWLALQNYPYWYLIVISACRQQQRHAYRFCGCFLHSYLCCLCNRLGCGGYGNLLVFIWATCDSEPYPNRRLRLYGPFHHGGSLFRQKDRLAKQNLIQESLGQLSLEGMVRLILAVLAVTLFFEGIGCAILGTYFSREFGLAKGMYYGLFHSISAFCNAGFDLFGGFKNLTDYAASPLVLITISLLLIFGGLGFSVIMDLFHLRRHRHLSLHSRLVLIITSILLIVGTGVFLLLEHNNPHTLGPKSFGEKLLNAWFGAASPRTAGFNTVALGQLRQATLFFVIILIFIGASPGSTGGGIKTTTFGIAVTSLWGLITGKDSLVVFKRTLPIIDSIKAFCVIFAALILITAVTFILTLTENAGFLPLLFEVTSAFGTVGLTTGITTSLSSVGKLILACTMFAGRLGPLTLATALSIRHRGPEAVHYPEERVGIG